MAGKSLAIIGFHAAGMAGASGTVCNFMSLQNDGQSNPTFFPAETQTHVPELTSHGPA